MKKTYLSSLARVTAASAVLFLFSCSGDGDKTGNDSIKTDSVPQKMSDLGARVPSPGDLFTFIKLAGSENVKADLLNPVDNLKNYTSKKAMALNFGTYASDALYCSAFNSTLKNNLYKYFISLKSLGDKLQVTTGITDKDQERVSKSLDNSDSLLKITNEKYNEAFVNLDQNNRGADLSLMLAGGWVEGLYLTCNMVVDFKKDEKFAQKIADQKESIGNLLEYMKVFESDANVADAYKQISDLKTSFDKISGGDGSATMSKNDKGKRVLGGGNKTSITEEQFKEIKDKVNTIRAAFIAAQ